MAYNPKTGKGLGRFYSAPANGAASETPFMISSAGCISTASWPQSLAATRS